MSDKTNEILEIVGDALTLINIGMPVARETFAAIAGAQALYKRIKAGEDIPIEEIRAAKHLVNNAGNDLLNTD